MLFSEKPEKSSPVKLSRPSIRCFSLLLIALMVGCASTAPIDETVDPVNEPEPVAQTAGSSSCDCESGAEAVWSDFDRGIQALADREYGVARIHFENHREGGSAQEVREAEVGIAFAALMAEVDSLTADSEFPDSLDERAEVMVFALAAVQALEGQLESLDAINAALTDDLEKRDEAIKRLRELTLGQQEAAR